MRVITQSVEAGGVDLDPFRPPSRVAFRAALRRARQRIAPNLDVQHLNITALLDLMTILLVFVLKNMMVGNVTPPQSTDLTLPSSVMRGSPTQEGIAVVVSRSHILVGDDPVPVVLLPSRQALAQSGADAKDKGDNPSSLYIVPLGQALASAQITDRAVRRATEREDASEATLIADARTPFRLVLEVVHTMGQVGFRRYHMLVLQGGGRP